MLLSMELGWATCVHLHGCNAMQVIGIGEGDGLILLAKVLEGQLHEYVKQGSKQDVIHRVINNMHLKLKFDQSKSE